MWVRNVLIESPEEEVAKKCLKDRFPDQARCLIEHVNSKPFTTLNQIRTYIKQKTGPFFSIHNIRMLLNELKITRKRTKRIVYKSQEYQSKLQIERREFLKKIKKIDRSKMVSIDESAFATVEAEAARERELLLPEFRD